MSEFGLSACGTMHNLQATNVSAASARLHPSSNACPRCEQDHRRAYTKVDLFQSHGRSSVHYLTPSLIFHFTATRVADLPFQPLILRFIVPELILPIVLHLILFFYFLLLVRLHIFLAPLPRLP
jgi:hypothetical protein